MTDDILWAWVAGLFEGEGNVHKKSNSNSVSVKISMVDEDIIRRLKAETKMGIILGPYEQKVGCKPIWRWEVGKRPEVDSFFLHVLPYLGIRRTQQVRKALSSRTPPLSERPRTHCRRGHPYNEENTYICLKYPKQRHCRLCRRDRMKASSRG